MMEECKKQELLVVSRQSPNAPATKQIRTYGVDVHFESVANMNGSVAAEPAFDWEDWDDHLREYSAKLEAFSGMLEERTRDEFREPTSGLAMESVFAVQPDYGTEDELRPQLILLQIQMQMVAEENARLQKEWEMVASETARLQKERDYWQMQAMIQQEVYEEHTRSELAKDDLLVGHVGIVLHPDLGAENEKPIATPGDTGMTVTTYNAAVAKLLDTTPEFELDVRVEEEVVKSVSLDESSPSAVDERLPSGLVAARCPAVSSKDEWTIIGPGIMSDQLPDLYGAPVRVVVSERAVSLRRDDDIYLSFASIGKLCGYVPVLPSRKMRWSAFDREKLAEVDWGPYLGQQARMWGR